eukprot:754452-Hanusia_phi.AAC.8
MLVPQHSQTSIFSLLEYLIVLTYSDVDILCIVIVPAVNHQISEGRIERRTANRPKIRRRSSPSACRRRDR